MGQQTVSTHSLTAMCLKRTVRNFPAFRSLLQPVGLTGGFQNLCCTHTVHIRSLTGTIKCDAGTTKTAVVVTQSQTTICQCSHFSVRKIKRKNLKRTTILTDSCLSITDEQSTLDCNAAGDDTE